MTYWSPARLFILVLVAFLPCPAHADEEKGETRKMDHRVFELRTYTAAPGKMDALHKRFRDHTCSLFRKHGMTIIGFWSPVDADGARTRLIYLLAFPDVETAKKRWNDFRDDPDWKKARSESEKDGPLLAKPPESVFLTPTDYSPIK